MDALEAGVVAGCEQAWAEEVDLLITDLLRWEGQNGPIEQAMERYGATHDWSEFDALSDVDKTQMVCLLHLVYAELKLRAGQKLQTAAESENPA